MIAYIQVFASLVLPMTPEMYKLTSPIVVGVVSSDARRSSKIVKQLERLASAHSDVKIGTLNCTSYAAFCVDLFGKECPAVVLKKKNERLDYDRKILGYTKLEKFVLTGLRSKLIETQTLIELKQLFSAQPIYFIIHGTKEP